MRRLSLLLLAGLAACGGGGDPAPVTPPPTPTIAVSLAPNGATSARGTTTTTTVSVARGGGYSGTITLGADAVPSGVTVTFSPATLTGSSASATANIAVGATAATGVSSINITATGSGVSSSSAAFALTVPTPAITLAAASATANATQGAAANVGLTITRTNGFNEAVTLAATGAPTGVTATFAPASIAAGATTSTLVLAAAATAAPGNYPITITASGTGVANVTTTVTLTVTAAATPAFSLSASPAALSVTAGQNGASTITAVRTGGFAGDVALTVTGAPAGMTAALTPTNLGAGVTTASLAITTTSATVPGAYTLTVNGTGTGVTAQSTAISVTVNAAPGITVSAVGAQQLSQGTSSPTGIPLVLTRTGGLAGDLTMSLEGAPAGVSATFAQNPVTGSGTQMTLNVAGTTTPGTYTLTVRATGAGGATGTTSFSLTVTAAATGSIAINAAPSSLSVVQGQTGLTTINIARAGGFTGGVTLTATGVPAGTTANFVPSVPTGAQSQLGFDVGAGTAPGTYTITVRGQGAGIADATTTLSLTVTPSSGGTGNVNWTFCAADRFPLWFAYQNGTSGAWTRVTPTGTNTRVYSFTVNGVGGVAYAIPIGGSSTGTQVTVQYLTQSEMTLAGTQECNTNRAKVNLTGTLAGLNTTNPLSPQSAVVSVGFATTGVSANGPFAVTGAPAGISDLLAVRSTLTIGGTGFTQTADRVILRRNTNYTSTIPAIDFATEGVAPASATYTITNLAGEQVTSATSIFSTANGSVGAFSTNSLTGAAALTVFGIPNSLVQSGDQHQVLITAITNPSSTAFTSRLLYTYNQQLANRTVTLGAVPSALTPTSLGTAPYVRFGATGSWQADYPDAVGIGYTQTATNANAWSMSMSRGYTGGGATWTMNLPDFSGVSGFQNSWGMAATSTSWAFTASGILSGLNTSTGSFSEGGSWRAASRTGSITP